ncbi:MAG: glycosyltransferase family 4 protein [Cellulomonas sp.]
MSRMQPSRRTRVGIIVEQCWQRVPGGSGTYITELTRALLDRADLDPLGMSALHARVSATSVGLTLPVRALPLPRAALYRLWDHTGAPRPEWTVPGLDVVHATTWAVPATRRPLVVTVHDLAFLRDPSHFTPHGVRFFTRALDRTRDVARAVIVPSIATARDCEQAGIEPERIHVVPHGARPLVPPEASEHRLILPDRYVLWCGTWEPRKNLAMLLAAFELVASQDKEIHLVLVGPRGWGDRIAPDASSPSAARVHLLGRLDPAGLDEAYARAEAFCFPSTWEGFGLPVLEAMAAGLPVVTSRDTSMAEIAAGVGVLVNPLDPTDIAAGILEAIGPAHPTLAALSQKRALDYTWAAAAEQTAAAYDAALRR